MRAPTRPLLAVLLLLCPGCTPAPLACKPPSTSGMTAQLLFGRSSKGGLISNAAWADFLASVVTPRFPDGLTVLDGYGQWRNPGTGEISHEASTLVEIVASDTPDTATKLNQIRDAYKTRFAQQSVGLVTTPSCAAF
jgi:hypothetical protein